MVEFDGLGRTVALAEFREFVDTVRVNVGTGGGWGPTDQVLDDEVTPRPVRNLVGLARHPQGAVAVWTRRSTSSNFNDDILVSRLSATWDTPKVFDAPNRYTTRVGRDQRRRARSSSPPGSTTARRRRGRRHPRRDRAVDHRRVGRHGADLARGHQRRTSTATPHAGGGGSAFYVGWGVHGAGELADGDRLDEAARNVRRARRPRRRPPPTRRRPTRRADPLPRPRAPPPTPAPTAGPPRRRAERDRRLHDAARGDQVRQRPQADAPLQAPAEGLHGQDRHGEGQRRRRSRRSRAPSSSSRSTCASCPAARSP